MASIIFNAATEKWRAFIRRKGHPSLSKTFRLKFDAEVWARKIESKIEGGATYELQELRWTTVGDLIERFRNDVVPHRKGWKWENNRCLAFQRLPWANMNLSMDIQGALMRWSDERVAGLAGKKVTAATVHRDLNLLGSVFQHAIKRLQINIPNGNPVRRVPRPKIKGGERSVVWTDRQLFLMLDHLGFNIAVPPTSVRSFLGWIFLIARLTGLRLGNVVGIQMKNIHLERRCIHFDRDEVKNNEDYDCPLSKQAVVILNALMAYRNGEARLFVSNAASISAMLRAEHREAVKKHPELKGLTTHDLRHTWTTEMAKKVPNHLALMKAAGRRTVKSLQRYYHPSVEDLAALLD